MRKPVSLFAPAILFVASSGPVSASGDWVDISEAVNKVRGDSSAQVSELYLKKGFPTNVKSVNLKGLSYKRAVLSWPVGSSTIKRDLLFNCSEYSYKENDGKPGYWYSMEWVLPGNQESTMEVAAFKYFCAASKSPWQLLTASVDDNEYYVNTSASYRFGSSKYGQMYTWVVAETSELSKYGINNVLRLYVSCGAKRAGFYSLIDAAGDKNIQLDEPNPGSIAAGIVRDIC